MNGEIEMWLDENHLLDKVNAISVISDPQRQGNISDEIFGFFFTFVNLIKIYSSSVKLCKHFE